MLRPLTRNPITGRGREGIPRNEGKTMDFQPPARGEVGQAGRSDANWQGPGPLKARKLGRWIRKVL